jgi:DNA repair exonuclease SbcCD ATPase subunit
MTDMVEAIADKLLEDHIALLNECESLRQRVADLEKQTEEINAAQIYLREQKRILTQLHEGAEREKELRQRVAELEKDIDDCPDCKNLSNGYNHALNKLAAAEQRIKELEGECEYDQRNAAMSQSESAMLLDKLAAVEKERDAMFSSYIEIKNQLAAVHATTKGQE